MPRSRPGHPALARPSLGDGFQRLLSTSTGVGVPVRQRQPSPTGGVLALPSRHQPRPGRWPRSARRRHDRPRPLVSRSQAERAAAQSPRSRWCYGCTRPQTRERPGYSQRHAGRPLTRRPRRGERIRWRLSRSGLLPVSTPPLVVKPHISTTCPSQTGLLSSSRSGNH